MEFTAESVAADRAAIAEEGTALAGLAEAGWERPVPTTPGWDIGALLVHVGGTHRWATANLTAGERVRLSQMGRPPDGRDLGLAWYREGLTALLDAAATIDPDAAVWTFAASGERRSAWWVRRMAQETTVHRWDAAAAGVAAGGPSPRPPDPRLAAAGIDEYLLDYLPRLPPETMAGWKGTLHLHTTDADGEWVIDLGDLTQPARHEHAKADTAVRGPASDMLLWLWNRQPATRLDAFGDTSVLERWQEITI
jgi:uncharacterized protein (TIGR03083 family)